MYAICGSVGCESRLQTVKTTSVVTKKLDVMVVLRIVVKRVLKKHMLIIVSV